MAEEDPDFKIPCNLASNLALTHDRVEVQSKLRADFLEVFNRNVPFPHVDKNAAPLQAILDYYRQSKVHAVGNVSEVARRYYKLKRGEQSTPANLSLLTGMDHPFAIHCFEEWILSFSELYNFNILDLLYWEEKCGSWLAMDHLEYDITWKENFTPYNCRNLLVNMLAVDEKFRTPPRFELYHTGS